MPPASRIRDSAAGSSQKLEEKGRVGKVGYGREAAPIRSVIRYSPVASRPGLSSASMFVPIRYWETRSRLVPSRGPLAAPAPHGGFLRPWFLGFEAPHPPPAAVVDSAWVPRRRETPVVLLLCCWICGAALLGLVVSKNSVSLQPKNLNIAVRFLFRKFSFLDRGLVQYLGNKRDRQRSRKRCW